jgi:hypothetical protein
MCQVIGKETVMKLTYVNGPDPVETPFVTASEQQFKLAEELRRYLEERYLFHPKPADPYECIDADD